MRLAKWCGGMAFTPYGCALDQPPSSRRRYGVHFTHLISPKVEGAFQGSETWCCLIHNLLLQIFDLIEFEESPYHFFAPLVQVQYTPVPFHLPHTALLTPYPGADLMHNLRNEMVWRFVFAALLHRKKVKRFFVTSKMLHSVACTPLV